MVCSSCEADNPPGRSTCTMCREPLGKSAKSAGKITKKKHAKLPYLLSRTPGSPLFLISMEPNPQQVKNFWGKVTSTPDPSLHGLDLSSLEKSEWAGVINKIAKEGHHFGISSILVNDFDQLIHDEKGLFAFTGIGDCQIELPDTSDGNGIVFNLAISSIEQAVEVTYDFFMRPDELLNLHDWIPFDNTPEPPSSNSNRNAYVAPVVTTTFIVTEGFDF